MFCGLIWDVYVAFDEIWTTVLLAAVAGSTMELAQLPS